MGIAERKAASEFEEKTYPKLKKELDAAAHFHVPVEVDWSTLALEGYEHLYGEAWPKVYFTPLVGALEALAVDELGREVLRSTLKRVVIRNTTGASSGSSMVHFKDGVLTLDHEPFSNIDDGYDRRAAIQNILEAVPEESESLEDPLAPFLSWKAHGVEAVLDVLQRLSWRQQAGIPLRLPRMSLLMRSGRSVTGILREVLEDRREGRAVLVHVPRDSGGSYDDVVIVPVGTLEAISVHDAPAFGSLSRDVPPTPSQLQLRRQLASLEAQLRGQLETSISVGLAPDVAATSAQALRALGFLAERTREVVEALVKDKVGRSALRESVRRIQLSVGEASKVSFADHTLELITGNRPVNWYTRSELEQAVQSAL